MNKRYCDTPEISCDDCQECFNEGESVKLLKDPKHIALDLIYWWSIASGNLKAPKGVKDHPLYPKNGNACPLYRFIERLTGGSND
jgi:hypothetical protein